MNSMTYKGYGTLIEYSSDDQCFVGRIAGIRDVVGFHGSTESEAHAAFRGALDDYLATCEKLGRTPDRPDWDSWFDGDQGSPDFMAVRERAGQ